MISALIDEADPMTLLRRYQALAEAGKEIVRTDIPKKLLPAFVELGLRVKGKPVRSIAFVTSDEFFSGDPDYAWVQSSVRRALQSPPARSGSAVGTNPTAPTQRRPQPTPRRGGGRPRRRRRRRRQLRLQPRALSVAFEGSALTPRGGISRARHATPCASVPGWSGRLAAVSPTGSTTSKGMTMDSMNNDFGQVLLWSFWFFIWIAAIFVWVRCLFDLFSDHELSGWAKAAWAVLLIFVPWVGALIYLIARGRSMAERQMAAAKQQQAAQADYIRDLAGTSGNPSAQIADAKKLLDAGTIDQAEFDALKAKALA